MNIEQKAVYRFMLWSIANCSQIFWQDMSEFLDNIDDIEIDNQDKLVTEFCKKYKARPFWKNGVDNFAYVFKEVFADE